MKTLITLMTLWGALAQAQSKFETPGVWCSEVEADNSENRLVLEENNQLVYEELDENKTLMNRTVIDQNRSHIWDGHAYGLITAPGFSLSYQGAFGCIRDVNLTIMANRTMDSSGAWILMRQKTFPGCAGLSENFCN